MIYFFINGIAFGQGVTTASMSGIVTDQQGQALVGANVVAIHDPSGTRYGASTRDNGQYNIRNMRIGGPYSVTVSYVGFRDGIQSDVFLSLGQDLRLDFDLAEQAVEAEQIEVVGELDEVLNSDRTGAATFVD
ncbi:MAG: TonB-dependent receptor, partial [Aliifodinibius sp.]|nr:carboxypeptidase regulatory-like domain-containing protein [Fodinibius sp.]NIV12599.1 TonB-dependent receptor [Fodinibius sp.]NIY26305.1 TonB-dependent receptor [Fodinibius sp.]